jgi:hypothetical protein
LGRNIDRVVTQPWKIVRERVTGSAASPLHASSFGKGADIEHIRVVAEFFRTQPFWRFGASFRADTKLGELSLMQAMKLVLQKRLNEIVSRTLCRNVVIIFESSQRANKIIQENIGDFELRRDRKRVPSECFFMPKSAADPALEVADFVINAVGRRVRQNAKDSTGAVHDFAAVFNSVEKRFTSYIEVREVVRNGS